MKKALLFTAALVANIVLSCYPTDKKNEVEPYPTYDTNAAMEHLNDSTTGTQSGQGTNSYNRNHQK